VTYITSQTCKIYFESVIHREKHRYYRTRNFLSSVLVLLNENIIIIFNKSYGTTMKVQRMIGSLSIRQSVSLTTKCG